MFRRLFFVAKRCHSTQPSLKWPSSLVRQTFLDYFTRHATIPHQIVPSSSVIPPKDSGTYFVNSGMNQFKSIFLGQRPTVTQRCVANSQKCIRVGGKHNDLSDVGHDTYHHTFFEMLGNWAFQNAYFKREACSMAFDLLTRVYGIEQDRLFFTYFQGEKHLVQPDDETRQIWLDLGIDRHRILPFGSKENFWEMGETGPCGPCTEIHYDHTGQADPSQVNRDNPRVVELWNLVFMQYERRQDKSLVPLSHVHVDTGMGLERLVAVLNSSESNYDTDLFTPLFRVIHSSASSPVYSQANVKQQYAYRLLADHARMFTIAMGDGLIPEKKGIAGLLKKMIERATRIAHEYLHIDETNVTILARLIPHVTEILSPAYPELTRTMARTIELVKSCEVNYMNKYQHAKPLLERFVEEKRSTGRISGKEIYRLYAGQIDQINVPLEMIEEAARLHPSLTFDWLEFDQLMREETRKSQLFSVYNKTIKDNQTLVHHPTEQLADGLRRLTSIQSTTDEPYKYQADQPLEAKLQAVLNDQGERVRTVEPKQRYYLVLDRTNFYSTAGGQSADQGTIDFSDQLKFQVEDVFRLHDQVLHAGQFVDRGTIVDAPVTCRVNLQRRKNLSRNHTALHLVNKILREVLEDPHLIQKASLIHEDYFIFEYSTVATKNSTTIFEELERRLNEIIRRDLPVSTAKLDFNSVRSDPSVYHLSNESYPDEVRCLSIGPAYSRELCGGTHVSSTGEIDDFLVVRVDSKGRSNKRLYCSTGPFAQHVRELFVDDFHPRFARLEANRDRLPLDQLSSECRSLRETYLDDKSLIFPFNQRDNFVQRWQELVPDKKLVRKFLLQQLLADPKKLFIESHVDLPIYEIGFMLLRSDDPSSRPVVIYINSHQRLLIVYLKKPRQRSALIDWMQERFPLQLIGDFASFDQPTRDLFGSTKKLLVFTERDAHSFDRLNFEQMCAELFSAF